MNHRSLTRASANRTANGQTQLSDWLKSATQAKIDEFVPKALELLKLEREEEVNSFQRQFTLSETKSEEQGSTDAVPAGKEDNVTLRGLTAVSMTPGKISPHFSLTSKLNLSFFFLYFRAEGLNFSDSEAI